MYIIYFKKIIVQTLKVTSKLFIILFILNKWINFKFKVFVKQQKFD